MLMLVKWLQLLIQEFKRKGIAYLYYRGSQIGVGIESTCCHEKVNGS
jgi:hypothetical protein